MFYNKIIVSASCSMFGSVGGEDMYIIKRENVTEWVKTYLQDIVVMTQQYQIAQ